ncbi:signal peptidase II [Novosphingobium resinovorum]|jgi:signal peptidase II|uniref:signal peptidase II n=1 Tax=Sphingomonadaceae TaxID=41297 RepID=UPI00027CA051|nr:MULTISPECIES: signal peptidase II [Sphingomonadaceae]EJU10100.1 lipoprotein signal peptidase [Sphingomonas sp. LH128]MBF7013088.1 signal peptidase II [Novosphingobium sp. HR1a]WJM27819.1 signal peptidase II [Novosphingobium resinovorum]
MNPWMKRAIGLLVAVIVYAIDQGIKGWITEGIDLDRIGQVYVLPFFNLTWTQNFGVSLGLFTAGSPEGRWALVAMTGAIAAFVFVWLLRERKLPEIAALGMVLGGAAGNIRDRFGVGYVIDYADLHFGAWRPFLIFNLADAAITIGVLIILARSLFSRDKPETEAQPAPIAD